MRNILYLKLRKVQYDITVSATVQLIHDTERNSYSLLAIIGDNGKLIASAERPYSSYEAAMRDFNTTLELATTQAYSHALFKKEKLQL